MMRNIATVWKPTTKSECVEFKKLSSGSNIISEEDFDKFLNEEGIEKDDDEGQFCLGAQSPLSRQIQNHRKIPTR